MTQLPAASPDDAVLPVERTEPDDTVRCRACGHDVTQRSLAIAVGGAHEHTFRNPAGYSFHVVCFADAPGCAAAGAPTSEATWFAGYAWQLALCSACGEHLGWWYVGAADAFAGLIAPRLR
jgi:hypothetical protein